MQQKKIHQKVIRPGPAFTRKIYTQEFEVVEKPFNELFEHEVKTAVNAVIQAKETKIKCGIRPNNQPVYRYKSVPPRKVESRKQYLVTQAIKRLSAAVKNSGGISGLTQEKIEEIITKNFNWHVEQALKTK